MITKYNNFIYTSIFENLINESLIYYTPPVINILTKLSTSGNDIAKELLSVGGTDVKPDITFVDFGDKDGYFEFSTMKNVQKVIGSKYDSYLPGGLHDIAKVSNVDTIKTLYNAEVVDSNGSSRLSTNPTGVFKTARNPIKIGRMVNSIFPSKFTAKEVEDFVNLVKSRLEKISEKFIIVEGDDIPKWYNSINYKEISGDLGRSCMAKKGPSIFKIYSENIDVCRMLTLVEDDKLIGRALIWKVKSVYGYGTPLKDIFFMDRQYTILQSDVEKFRKYAMDNNWAYKTHNNHHSLETVTYNNQEFNAEMEVQLETYKNNSYDYNEYPYLDTFRRYDPSTGVLYNDSEHESNIGNYILDSTDGEYTVIDDNVWSEWYDCEIDREYAIWSTALNDWLYRENSVLVDRGDNQGYYPDSYDDIVYDSYIEEYIHIESSVYCEQEGDYIYTDNALVTITELDDDCSIETTDNFYKDSNDIVKIVDIIKEDREWYNKLSENIPFDDYGAIYCDLITNNYKNEYILKMYEIETFLLLTDNEKDRFYLTKDDAKLLNFDIIETESRDIDWFDYYKEIKTYNKPTLFRNNPLVTIKDIYISLENARAEEKDIKTEYNLIERVKFLEEFYSNEIE